MKWRDEELQSPFSGKPLLRDTPHSLTDGKYRYPIIDEIPFLRSGREELRKEVLSRLDRNEKREALILLFRDQDDWACTAPPAAGDLECLFDESITLRTAMSCLQYGPVADYFAYRWSDPTFLSGLRLLETHFTAPAGASVCELACGIGHYLREFGRLNIKATGVDVVFSKLWLARRFVASDAKLVCTDANDILPFAGRSFDAAFCHDAFYFLSAKERVAHELKRIVRGPVLIGHAHNLDTENFSSGASLSVAGYAALFGGAVLYDDAELTRAFIENRPPHADTLDGLACTEAVSLAFGAGIAAEKSSFVIDKNIRKLQINPLIIDDKGEINPVPHYPSPRYRDEYEALSGYLNLTVEETARLAHQSDLTWAEIERFARRRLLLDLPEKW